ncbi:DUF4142 domain-containing protein [Dyadobacter flavalbus]|uniref:DUF4142 domain-containing protein n=2 Tax=Dyadobacter flavalbus TaxID=2579942 RepID=A0A5M8QCZ9_9BACT|nr:DUF4142 domain-containing protein [Dyadobacter flavalbus]
MLFNKPNQINMKNLQYYLFIAGSCLLTAFTTLDKTAVPFQDEDRTFVKAAAEGGLLEVKLGELAMKNGSSKAVKDYGKMMINDHSKVNKELMSLARKKQMEVPTTLSPEKQQKYDSLAAVKDNTFDMVYMNMMILSHEQTIGIFQNESSAGTDADLKKWAESKVPALKHHLEMAESLFQTANKK